MEGGTGTGTETLSMTAPPAAGHIKQLQPLPPLLPLLLSALWLIVHTPRPVNVCCLLPSLPSLSLSPMRRTHIMKSFKTHAQVLHFC